MRIPEAIEQELLPELRQVLQSAHCESQIKGLVTYCALWHPSLSQDIRLRNRNAVKRVQLPASALTVLITNLAGQNDITRLLADRGPDFGLSLLVILELCFQVAFCLRKPTVKADQPRPSQDELSRRSTLQKAFFGCSKLLETLSLHLDCPPLQPHYQHKFALTCLGFLYHRKIPAAAQSRFFQLHYFLIPEIRSHAFEKQPLSWEIEPVSDPRKTFLPPKLAQVVEETLWRIAKELSLGKPSTDGFSESIKVTSRQTAMAVTFEILNHLAIFLFGTSLCLYGSAATGFATVDSDVDVVLQLGESGVSRMIEEIAEARSNGAFDLNPFPSRNNGGFQQALGTWSWADEKAASIAATIWGGRKLAWAVHRFLGWDVQCVQTAYVPIIRITGCVDEDGYPRIVPQALRPCQNLETRYLPSLSNWRRLLRPGQDMQSLLLEEVLVPHPLVTPSPSALSPRKKGQRKSAIEAKLAPCRAHPLKHKAALELVSQVGGNIVSEKQYAAWNAVCYNTELLPAAEALLSEKLGLLHAAQSGLPSMPDEMSPHFLALQDALRSFIGERSSADLVNDMIVLAEPGLERVPPEELYPEDKERLSRIDEEFAHAEINAGEASTVGEDKPTIWLVESDFSMDRAVGIHNSRLLRAYAACDPRVVALGLLIKHWARRREIGDAFVGYLSGYQWTLMVIHFLQHFLCLQPPNWLKHEPQYDEFQKKVSHLTRDPLLPLLPNLQKPPAELGPFEPVTIDELEGEADVFFYEPGVGQNRSLPRRLQTACREAGETPAATPAGAESYKQFPEDTLLEVSPLAYALELLSCPFELNPALHETLEDENAQRELWLCRVATVPRPTHAAHRPKAAECRRRWDGERRTVKTKLEEDDAQHSTERRGSAAGRLQVPFPELKELRTAQFERDHLMTRESLYLPYNMQADVTLTELLYAFFEYYGMRFNYATDMSDIDRVPLLPEGKKEFFETSYFKPMLTEQTVATSARAQRARAESVRGRNGSTQNGQAEERRQSAASNPGTAEEVGQVWDNDESDGASSDSSASSTCEESHPAAREVRGRGKGAFQYQGRHFVCIRDPFEKLRTIGPLFRCQSHLSSEILSAMQLFGWLRVMQTDDFEEAKQSLQHKLNKLFEPKHSQAHLFHPIKEGLADLLTRCCHLDRFGDERAGDFGSLMYPELTDSVRKFGNYTNILAQRGSRNSPQADHPLLSTTSLMSDAQMLAAVRQETLRRDSLKQDSARRGSFRGDEGTADSHQNAGRSTSARAGSNRNEQHKHDGQRNEHSGSGSFRRDSYTEGEVNAAGEPAPPGFEGTPQPDALAKAFVRCGAWRPNEGELRKEPISTNSGWKFFLEARAWLESRSVRKPCRHRHHGGGRGARTVSQPDSKQTDRSHPKIAAAEPRHHAAYPPTPADLPRASNIAGAHTFLAPSGPQLHSSAAASSEAQVRLYGGAPSGHQASPPPQSGRFAAADMNTNRPGLLGASPGQRVVGQYPAANRSMTLQDLEMGRMHQMMVSVGANLPPTKRDIERHLLRMIKGESPER